ncbi:MAG: hypothetical protein JXQ75_00265 [Phycisphaerae bacterium]|nr:hypothetical protein [Phycisphaerae bacterium]
MDEVKWLLEDDAPGVAYVAGHRLLGEDPASRKMKSLRRRCNEYPPVARMLDRLDEALAAGNYKKYEGAYWTLIFLAEMQADGRDKRTCKLADHVLSTQLPNGGFSASGKPRYEIVCLTANLLRSLVHFGYGEDERVVRGYRRLIERIVPHGGVPCAVMDYTLHASCKMTLPQTLRCLAVAPPSVPKRSLKKARDLLVDQLLAVRVYRYVRPDAKAYYVALDKRPKGMKVRDFKARWLAEHKVSDEDLLPKPGWLRFGFPRHYNPDLLEAMLALAELGVKHTPVLDDALDHIETKRGKDGRWKLADSLNGKMLADIERKGKPSKWITLRALVVLNHYGRIDV